MNINQILKLNIEESVTKFNEFKTNTIIGIYGSFLEDNEKELCKLRDYLKENGYNAIISKDIQDSFIDSDKKGVERDRIISKKLIEISHIHIFVLKGKSGDPPHIIQSASMELERLNTLMEYGLKQPTPVIIYCENEFIETSGSICHGLLLERSKDWEIEEFENIEDIFVHARQFCFRKIREMYHQ